MEKTHVVKIAKAVQTDSIFFPKDNSQTKFLIELIQNDMKINMESVTKIITNNRGNNTKTGDNDILDTPNLLFESPRGLRDIGKSKSPSRYKSPKANRSPSKDNKLSNSQRTPSQDKDRPVITVNSCVGTDQSGISKSDRMPNSPNKNFVKSPDRQYLNINSKNDKDENAKDCSTDNNNDY